jgi:carbamate kinase
MSTVIALGGNAIAGRGDSLEADAQRNRVREAASAIADIARGQDVVVTHGNGPQVGLLAMQAEVFDGVAPYPLDWISAESEGLIGYLLELELASIFPSSEVATLLTQVVVDADDPAFATPTKPIGPVLSEAAARVLREERGWSFAKEASGLRRVVASPEPRRIREQKTISRLVDAGVLVICAGGGGIPVVDKPGPALRGVEAVVDKDLSSALLASGVGAERLLLLTDVDAVYEDWDGMRERPIRSAPAGFLRALELAPGSMGPKVEAACRFAEAGGEALIGRVEDARAILQGDAGTRVGGEAPSYWPSPKTAGKSVLPLA